MDIAKRFGTDKQAEVEGVWIDMGDTSRVRLARVGNPRYEDLRRRLRAPYAAGGFRSIPDDVQLQIYRRLLAETVIIDWEGFELDSEPFPFTAENALRLITDFVDFGNFVSQAAESMETFRRAHEDAEGNSSSTRSGRKAAVRAA